MPNGLGAMLVYDYLSLANLAKLGFSNELDSIYCFEVDAYNVIANTINDEQSKELKKSSRKRK